MLARTLLHMAHASTRSGVVYLRLRFPALSCRLFFSGVRGDDIGRCLSSLRWLLCPRAFVGMRPGISIILKAANACIAPSYGLVTCSANGKLVNYSTSKHHAPASTHYSYPSPTQAILACGCILWIVLHCLLFARQATGRDRAASSNPLRVRMPRSEHHTRSQGCHVLAFVLVLQV